MDAESDLTDFDDYEDKPADKDGDYVIRRALKVPRACTYTSESLFNQIANGTIDLDPEYQRVVWTMEKQIVLIDSILRNYYIPPIIFALVTSEDGSEARTCIDGKQRLTSIHRFMEGLIPHKDPQTHKKYWYKVAADAKPGSRPLLSNKYRAMFASKQIVCVEYTDLTDSDQRDIFHRVQLGMALTPAEKLQGKSGLRSSFVREMQSQFVTDDGLLSNSISWAADRGNSFKNIALTAFYMDMSLSALTRATNQLGKLDKWLSDKDAEISSSLRNKMEKSYDLFVQLVKSKKYSKVFSSKKVSPVEMVAIPLLIRHYMNDLDLAGLAEKIDEMRKEVRRIHTDVRTNERVFATLIAFIAGNKSSGKRKRHDDDMDDSSDEDDESYGKKRPKAKARK